MKVLFLTQRLPFKPNRGDRTRAYFLLRELSRFAEVSLFSLIHDREEQDAVGSVPFVTRVATAKVTPRRNAIIGATQLLSERPLTHSLLDAPDASAKLRQLFDESKPDVVIALCSSMAKFALEAPLSSRPLVVDFIDADSGKWRQLGEQTNGPLKWIYAREARTLGAFEATVCERAFATFVVNERERDTLKLVAPGADVGVVEVGVEVDDFRPPGPPVESPEVVFCGVMDYGPNDEGVRWFLEAVWPIVRRSRADARFTVVGRSPSRSLRAAADTDPSVTVTGAVPSVQPYLWQSALSVAPLRRARGVQTKVLEAVAAGLPVVVTEAVISGLPEEVRAACISEDDPERFAQAVLAQLALPAAERRARAERAQLSALSWQGRLARVEQIVRAAAAHRRSQ
jgi:sugar transferase (PEP-CTERM/EpsH1 system associated)